MGWLERIFRKKEITDNGKQVSAPKAEKAALGRPFEGMEGIRIGRYSDNGKSYSRTQKWYVAEDRYKEKNYTEMFAAFFDYLCDEEERNVSFKPDGKTFTFELIQGSKKIHGHCDGERLVATAKLAKMEKPSVPVMRMLLNMNYGLFYTRFALEEDNTLCMIFDSMVQMASPNKLYYGLKELATKADRQDDLLVADFAALKPVGTDHITPLSDAELDVKYTWFRKWIQDILAQVSELNADSFSGSIAYCLLVLIYRIDFLIVPEAKLLAELERISGIYWDRKDDVTLVERNALMKAAIRKLLDITREEFAKSVYHSHATFASSSPGSSDKMRDNIITANKDAHIDIKYPKLALTINEYGPLYNHWSISVPKIITELTRIYMAVMHAEYFKALGMKHAFYEPETKTFNKELIKHAIDDVLAKWPDKYVDLRWDHSKIKWDGLFEFGISYTETMGNMNLETRK